MQDGDQGDDAFPSREAVAKFLRGREGRETGGKDLQLGERIGPDLEQPAGVGKLVDFIEDPDRLLDRAVEVLRVEQTLGDSPSGGVQPGSPKRPFDHSGLLYV